MNLKDILVYKDESHRHYMVVRKVPQEIGDWYEIELSDEKGNPISRYGGFTSCWAMPDGYEIYKKHTA